jgi:adenosylmethionine-8-amino-7-oxononanoate aminotransferase
MKSPIWHPFTQHALAPREIFVQHAEGAYLFCDGDRAILDAISSWWVITHGHGHPRIAQAIRDQLRQLEQVIFAGFTHGPAERVAAKLLAKTPASLTHVFFSDTGSTAVEVAIKMAVGAWHNRGKPRHRIAAMEHAYHGDMFGAMSVGHRGVFNAAYGPMLFEVSFVPFPDTGSEQNTLDSLEELFRSDRDGFAAAIFEPLVLGAGGMLMYPAHILGEIAKICRHYGVWLILDEVMTGFGRAGSLFACNQAGVEPDLLCLSKGITGGFLPMGATLTREEIYDAFWSRDRSQAFFHSSSYTGNALACAAAAANLDIWDEEPVMERIAAIAEFHAGALKHLSDRPEVASVRQCGTIAAVELKVSDPGYLAGLGPRLGAFYLEKDVLLRPLGNVVYILPPYCAGVPELERIYGVIDESLALVGK